MTRNATTKKNRRTASRLPDAFELGKYEVTQAQWKAVMGTNPSGNIDDNRPVENSELERRAELHVENECPERRLYLSTANRSGVGVCRTRRIGIRWFVICR